MRDTETTIDSSNLALAGCDTMGPAALFLDAALSGQNVFLTGMAGTGKSTLLREFLAAKNAPDIAEAGSGFIIRPKTRIDVTAPTGIAALNVGGSTIHRWSGMLLGPTYAQTDEQYFEWLQGQPYRSIRQGWRRIETATCLVIDEISMFSGRQFQFLEWLFRRLRDDDRPWGGCQVIVIGDFLQLAPVKGKGQTFYDWAFRTVAWADSGFLPVVLDKVHRQSEMAYIAALAGVREGNVTGQAARTLHARVSQFPEESIPRLYTHNTQVDRWNGVMLDSLEGEEMTYHGIRSGTEKHSKFLAENLVCPEELTVKPGARVMFTINDKEGAFVNGSLGTVLRATAGCIDVELDSGGWAASIPYTWKQGEGADVGFYSQHPLRLAYAMTIHKSQGLSLDAAYIDIRAAREPGQAYVALSRVRTLGGLHLKDWFGGLFVSEAAVDFHRSLRGAGKP